MPYDPRNLFLEYYGQYIDAKHRNDEILTWLKAVQCRYQLQKIGDSGDSPGKESQICQDIFEAFVTKKKAEEIYIDLYNDSRSYPGKRTDDTPYHIDTETEANR
jgi:hypothetical protein